MGLEVGRFRCNECPPHKVAGEIGALCRHSHIVYYSVCLKFCLISLNERFEIILSHPIVSLRGVKATKQSPKPLVRRLPRADALAMTAFSHCSLKI